MGRVAARRVVATMAAVLGADRLVDERLASQITEQPAVSCVCLAVETEAAIGGANRATTSRALPEPAFVGSTHVNMAHEECIFVHTYEFTTMRPALYKDLDAGRAAAPCGSPSAFRKRPRCGLFPPSRRRTGRCRRWR